MTCLYCPARLPDRNRTGLCKPCYFREVARKRRDSKRRIPYRRRDDGDPDVSFRALKIPALTRLASLGLPLF